MKARLALDIMGMAGAGFLAFGISLAYHSVYQREEV